MNILVGGIILTIIWGILPVLQKKLLTKNISSTSIMFISGTTYYILLLLYAFYNKDQILSDLKTINGNWKIFSLIFVLNFIGVILYYNLLNKHSSSAVSVITSIWPVFNIIFAYFLLAERISPNLILLLSVILIINIYLFKNALSS